MKVSQRASRGRVSLPACVLLTFSSAVASAQVAGTGTIQGTIQDVSGAVVPGARVEAVESETNLKVTQATSSSGTYSLTALPPGSYTVHVSAPNFRTLTQERVVVNAVTVVGLDLTLQVGSADQTVVVTSAPPDIETENGSLSTTIPNSTYTSLPLALNGAPKNPLGFLSLVPGVAGGDFGVVNINGGPSNTSFLYLNGLPLTTSEMQGDARNVQGSTSTEVVDSFQVISSGVPSYYEGQGITNLVSKSGTNQFHGDLYENIRNTAFDAGGFTPLPGTPKPPEHQNEYGGSLGGPILHNRLFFFGNVDRFKIISQNPQVLYSLPTTAERAGDFSALLGQGVTIYDPATTVCNAGVCTRQAFPGNVIPTSRISPIATQLQSYLPATENSGLQNNFQNAYTAGTTQTTYMGKVDTTISDKQHAFFLVQYGNNATVGIPNNGGPQLPEPYGSTRTSAQKIWVAEVGHTWALTSRLTNVFGLEFNRFNTPFLDPTNGGGYATKSGLTGLPSGPASDDFPSISFSGVLSPTFWHSSGNSQNVIQTANSFVFQDNVALVKGKHNIVVGGQAIIQEENTSVPNVINGINFASNETSGFLYSKNSNGVITSSSADPTNGNAYASYLLGAVDNAGLFDTTIQVSGARYRDYAVYVQDDWKVTPKLAVNLGLRYIIPKPYFETRDRVSFFNPTLPNPAVDNYPGALQFAGNGPDSCHCATNVATHYLTFDPRVGMAYAFTQSTVLRGSFGINHFNGGALGGNAYSQGPSQLGFSASPSFTSPDGGITPAFNWSNGIPAYQLPPFFDPTLNTGYNTTVGATGGGVAYNRPDTAGRMPYTENYNLTLDQAFTRGLTLELSYAGSESHFIGTNGGVGIYSDQIMPQYEALGGLLTTAATPASIAQVQAVLPGFKLPYANFVGSIGQALRPFPQYAGVGDLYADFGAGAYNSLQARVEKRASKGLYFLTSYTWSKTMNDSGGTINFIYGAPRSAYNLHQEWSPSSNDTENVFSGVVVYDLPFGRGHAFGNTRLSDLLVGGWRFSGIFQYSTGTPIGPVGAPCTVPYAGNCYADYGTSQVARINGAYGSQRVQNRNAVYLNRAAFANPAPFSFGNTPRTAPDGLRNPGNAEEDISLGKDFHLVERLTFRLQGDAFNVLNRVIVGGLDTNLGDATFGQFGGQANAPRKLQLEGYIRF